ncbi:prepilin-type N-terminal cleavage/methylation domain-containing protein [Alteribacter keqinensis]|uniref:Prepilin-type N-terminal cleavage/methylation domain-containing protein n=2 Tax=Alteribacter keqinensis TaxID=2483800 RepID=A0A3M7TYI7_9BACI|nr:prepilin-type N-terminal cleavage/methylation domain-containing protein [Alteribacter keqinensis]RNA70656.1 prepilin-type N-terminal cleavage/methylation domain-containing protein [Alteribacter keqinensis]
MMRNEKGLTLVELLAVIVILGIIAAIAIPAIGGIIDNSKKDAHIANAETLANAARLYVTSNPGTGEITAEKLSSEGYIESVPKNPDGGSYSQAKVVIGESDGNITYTITLGTVIVNENIEEIREKGRGIITQPAN